MTRGDQNVHKVIYQGANEDFIVFIDDPEELQKWKKDSSIPLSSFVGSFKVFISHGHGAEGILDGASKSTLSNEFGTDNEDEVVKAIVEKGQLQTSKGNARGGDRNDSKGARLNH